MNKKASFFTLNIFTKMLFLLLGIIFTTEFAHCSTRAFQPEETEEEIGTHTHGNITELSTPSSSRYERLDWWLSILPVIKINAGKEECDSYEKIVKSSLNNMGLVYQKPAEFGGYVGHDLAAEIGLDIISDDFETAFDKKLEEFKTFSANYLESKAAPCQKTKVKAYNNFDNFFNGILEKKDMHTVERYQVNHIGDLHGDLVCILTILKNNENSFKPDFSLADKSKFFVFTGDYIDRGQFGLEILFILMSLKIKNPDNVFLLLGNHEAGHLFLRDHNQGFANEVAQKFDFGTIDFQVDQISGSGVPRFTEFMVKVQSKFFKYLPTALLMKTEFGNIVFCHGLPDPANEPFQIFLRSPTEIQIDFINRHPQFTRFTNSDLAIKTSTAADKCYDARSEASQQLEVLGDYMDKADIFLCMRGHQHNETIESRFDIKFGGIIAHKLSEKSVVVTTLSFDFACFMPSLQIIGNYAHYCVLDKNGDKLRMQGISIDRYTAQPTDPTDRINPRFEIKLKGMHEEVSHEKVAPMPETERPSDINPKITQLCMEIQKLSTSGMPIFGSPDLTTLQKNPLWVIENLYYFFSQIQNIYKMNLDMIYELLLLLGIISEDGFSSISKLTTLPSEDKLLLIQIMRDESQNPLRLISNIQEIRKVLASGIFRIDNTENFKLHMKGCLNRINTLRCSIAKKLYSISKKFKSIQSYLDQTDEPKISAVKKLKALVSNPAEITFDQIIMAILGSPSQEAV